MTLPHVTTLQDCASYARTVEPYIDEFWGLPAAIATSLAGLYHDGELPNVLEAYVHTNPLVLGLAISLVLGVIFLVVSEVNGNYSQVDRCWSLLPTVYIAHYNLWARLAGLPSHRLDAVLFISTIWSIRLTYNYARKGGYNVGSEDYRWKILQSKVPSWAFHLLNLTFISFMQSVLLFLIAAPAYTILLSSGMEKNMTVGDWVFVAFELGLVLVEWLADEQQWRYQSAKSKYRATAKVPSGFAQEDLDRGFLAKGLWAFSRHPNFAAEQAVWLVLYQWSCYAADSVYAWNAAGAAFLVLLFQSSTWLTEIITAGKYPEYKDYQNKVGMFTPTRFSAYEAPPPQQRRVIRASELAKKALEREATASGVQTRSSAAKRQR